MKNKTSVSKPDRRRVKALIWLIAVGAVIGTLISYGQVSIIYVLSTISLIVLLLLVGFSDLEKVGVEQETALSPSGESEKQIKT